jgi:hypothetical protein
VAEVFRLKRKHFYFGVLAIGIVWGLLVGIDGRNCDHPSQPPFLECLAEAPEDLWFPTLVITSYLLLLAGFLDLLHRAVRRTEWLVLASVALGAGLGAWWSSAVGEICTDDPPDVTSCYGFSGRPGALVPIVLAGLISGLVGLIVTRIRPL